MDKDICISCGYFDVTGFEICPCGKCGGCCAFCEACQGCDDIDDCTCQEYEIEGEDWL